MKRADPGAKSQLQLLQARIRNESFKGQNLESIIQLMAAKYEGVGLRRISTTIGIPPAHWYQGGAVADSAGQMVNICLERQKVEELVDLMAKEYPEAFV